MKVKSIEEIRAYYEGKRSGIRLYAWWKDGMQYIGTTGKTLQEAITELYKLEEETCVAFSEGKEIWMG